MRRVGLGLALGSCLVFLAFVIPQLGRPLMYDDANFAFAMRAAAETGVPFGNQGWMSERGDFSQREQWALWHPPLYIYADALLVRLFGWSPWVMRLGGVFGGLATALLTWLLARDLTRGSRPVRELAGGLAVALVMVSPLVVQSALILDIDFSVLLPLTLLLLWLYLRLEDTRLGWLWLAPVFGLLLWAKMTNPLPLVGVLLVWQMLRGQFGRAVVQPLTIGLGGLALFGLTWVSIGTWLGFPLDMPFGVNLVQWQDSAEVARRAYRGVGAFIEALQPPVLWLGPGLVALGLIGLALRGALLARTWQVRGADLLIGVLIVFALGYVNKTAGWFPKYQVAFAPLLACLAAPYLAHAWAAHPRLVAPLAVGATAAGGALTYVLVADTWALERTYAIEAPAGFWLIAIVVVGAAIGLARRSPAVGAAAALLGVAVGWSLAVNTIQLRAPYQTDYWYGTRGTVEAARWVDDHLQPSDTYVAAKEVALRSHAQRYVDQDNYVYYMSAGRPIEAVWANAPVRALVTWEREPYVADLFQRAARELGFTQTARFGDYVVYEPVPAAS